MLPGFGETDPARVAEEPSKTEPGAVRLMELDGRVNVVLLTEVVVEVTV